MAEGKSKAKGRKIGRHAKRSPSMARYRGENRMAVNKRKAIERHDRRMAKKAKKLGKRFRPSKRAAA